MSDRMLRADLFKSDRFLTLPDPACRLAFIACVADADDLGNFEAQPGQLRRLWLATDVANLDDVERIVKALGAVDLVRWYTELSTGKRYGHIPRFRQRLRSIKRAHPRPPPEVECNEIKELISKLPDNGQTIERLMSGNGPSFANEVKRSEGNRREGKGSARTHASPVDNSNAPTAPRSAPPPGFFEKEKGKLPTPPEIAPSPPSPPAKVNGHQANRLAVGPLNAILRSPHWKTSQASIAAVAATLELRPQPGETFAQLADRCQTELAKRQAS